MFDLKITGGTIVDGTGAPSYVGDIAVIDGKIVEVGAAVPGEAKRTLDATGRIVTPGFVDVHTHYDGQVTWDETLEPSSGHGVTTVVMGNCGVGFAPVRPGKEEWLIQLMEGVEDIPGTALSEGMTWNWETFPEYLDALEKRKTAIDFGTQIAHGPLRAYVMGDRGAKNEPATSEDIATMRQLVREAIDAGALGVSTSRVLGHRAMDGEPVPGTFAAEDELFGLGYALRDAGKGIFELAPAGADGQDLVNARREVEWMRRLSAEIERPVTFALVQNEAEPELWREIMSESVAAADEGARLYPQVAARPFGLMIGLQTHHAFAKRPTFIALKKATSSLAELAAEMRKPEIKQAILSEEDVVPDPTSLFDGMTGVVRALVHKLYAIGDPPDYEPGD
ncbi:MAG: amidohydrolase family protein, partial [Myxococcota bacterium]